MHIMMFSTPTSAWLLVADDAEGLGLGAIYLFEQWSFALAYLDYVSYEYDFLT